VKLRQAGRLNSFALALVTGNLSLGDTRRLNHELVEMITLQNRLMAKLRYQFKPQT
jgi:hypothetical protein